MARISQSTRALIEAVDEISHVLQEQSAASELIARNVEQVATMNEENSAAMQRMVEDVHRLRALGGVAGVGGVVSGLAARLDLKI